MTTFSVNDMTCGHCVAAITKAVESVDSDAVVHVRLDSKRVEITSTQPEKVLADAIAEAGYTPVAL
jgi:copper chaperone